MNPFSILASPDLQVGFVIKRITGYAHGVEIWAINVEPFLRDLGTVADNAGRFNTKLGFAVLDDLAQKFGLEERFASGDVHSFHPGVCEELQTALSFREGKHLRVFCGMEAEAAGIVADAVGEVVY